MHELMLGGHIRSHLDIFRDTQETNKQKKPRRKEGRKEKASFNTNPTEIFSEHCLELALGMTERQKCCPQGASVRTKAKAFTSPERMGEAVAETQGVMPREC